jgi:hypothetical protein
MSSRPAGPAPRPEQFRPEKWAIIRARRSPRDVQRYLRSLPYNWEKDGETLRTFRGVVKHGSAHCLEAALAAATILEQHDYPPLLLDLESRDLLDHVLLLFREFRDGGRWGAVARSRDFGLHGRKPVFRTLRHLVMSYVDTYVDPTARIIAYGVLDLRDLRRPDWRLSSRNVWKVAQALIDMPHQPLATSDRRHHQVLRQFLEFKRKYPERPVDFYPRQDRWL